jgi:hypothetical protein
MAPLGKTGLLFCKKEAKNFYVFRYALKKGPRQRFQGFLVLFFKKELLSYR